MKIGDTVRTKWPWDNRYGYVEDMEWKSVFFYELNPKGKWIGSFNVYVEDLEVVHLSWLIKARNDFLKEHIKTVKAIDKFHITGRGMALVAKPSEHNFNLKNSTDT